MAATEKKFSWPAFIAWFVLLFGLGALVYLVYYALKATDRCTTCHAKTFSSPPPGYVLNPHSTATYVPQEVLHRQEQLYRQQQILAQPPPRAEMLGGRPAPPESPSLPPHGAEAWSNVSRPDKTACPGCGHVFAVESRRPLEVACPSCGTRGTLAGAGGASW
jgi:hypothetical protein